MNRVVGRLEDPALLVEAVLHEDRVALARVLTLVENDTPAGREALNCLYPYTGRAHLIGVTGSPGTGKSTLVNQLARHYRRARLDFSPRRVAIIAVDPTSPFTGGAVLGDRVRMRDLVGDPGVFIRSMATRGALGGLARTTAALVQVFDAAGYDVILIETVGAGQSEVDVARLAHTTLVVEAPGMGDDVQAIKAGILEIADILVVNKADRPGAENSRRALEMMIEMSHPTAHLYQHPNCPPDGTELLHHAALPTANGALGQPDEQAGEPWTPPVLLTTAHLAAGVEQLFQAVLRHEAYLRASGEWQRRDEARIRSELDTLLQAALVERWQKRVPLEDRQSVIDDLVSRRTSPLIAVRHLLGE